MPENVRIGVPDKKAREWEIVEREGRFFFPSGRRQVRQQVRCGAVLCFSVAARGPVVFLLGSCHTAAGNYHRATLTRFRQHKTSVA